jgi:hypothetical protein
MTAENDKKAQIHQSKRLWDLRLRLYTFLLATLRVTGEMPQLTLRWLSSSLRALGLIFSRAMNFSMGYPPFSINMPRR